MAKKIIWTKRSIQKFNKIIEFLSLKWGNQVTRNFVSRTYDILELIAEHPELGTLEHIEKNIRGFLLTKHNRLFYRVEEESIIVLNFFDTRSNPKTKNF